MHSHECIVTNDSHECIVTTDRQSHRNKDNQVSIEQVTLNLSSDLSTTRLIHAFLNAGDHDNTRAKARGWSRDRSSLERTRMNQAYLGSAGVQSSGEMGWSDVVDVVGGVPVGEGC